MKPNVTPELSRRQEAGLAALLSEPTMAAAAKRAGVARKTLWTWMQEPNFQARYRAGRGHVMDANLGALILAADDAVATLRRNLNSDSEAIQVRAASAILNFALRGHELLDVSERLEDIKDALAIREGME